MRYVIVTNPVSGRMSIDQKRSALTCAAEILGAEIKGLDTSTPEDFRRCLRETSNHCDVLVAAGGDGTLSEVINALDTHDTPLAYLPLGSGNSMKYALNYRGGLTDIAKRILKGRIRHYDLIDCDRKKRAFMVSAGFEGSVLKIRNRYLARGATGFWVYLKSALRAYFKEYRRLEAKIHFDGSMFNVSNLLTLMIFKQPYYGYGMNIMPKARFDDGLLHTLCVTSGLIPSMIGAGVSFILKNPLGRYGTCRQMTLELNSPVFLQIDGDRGWEDTLFRFSVLPGALKIKC